MINEFIEYLKSKNFIHIDGDYINIETNQFTIDEINADIVFIATGGKELIEKNYSVEIVFANSNFEEFNDRFNLISEINKFLSNFNQFAGLSNINYEKIDNSFLKSKLTFTIKEFQYVNSN